MFVVLKKKLLLFVLVSVLAAALVSGAVFVAVAARPTPSLVVVLDAGHGGVDKGVVGRNSGFTEADVNLEMSRLLESDLRLAGAKVVQTRKTKDGLYRELTRGFKQEDMQSRKNTILNAEPDLVVSLHCNKFPETSRRGIQVFYEKNSPESASLAALVQANVNVLNASYVGRTYDALSGDYFMLKCSPYPSIIVECGFLSNPEDEKLLLLSDYREELSFAIFSGINAYLSTGI